MSDVRREVEVKIPCQENPLDRFPELVREIVAARHFEDNWLLDFDDRRLARKDSVLRVRLVGDRGWITFKRAVKDDTPYKVREEIEAETDNPQAVLALLRHLDLKPVFRYQKFRTSYRVSLPSGASLSAMYDETPIGNFLEVEGTEAAIDEFLGHLGIAQHAVITLSYPALYKARCRESGGSDTEMVFGDTTMA
ncbi:MAG TPA: class IV adenylate cyclase [Blastocatellia bacterium]|nr:class IV adenylate cyclase [Blastocatellia bacterium]